MALKSNGAGSEIADNPVIRMGFWPGGEGKRLKVTGGNNDGSDRVRLGTIEIK